MQYVQRSTRFAPGSQSVQVWQLAQIRPLDVGGLGRRDIRVKWHCVGQLFQNSAFAHRVSKCYAQRPNDPYISSKTHRNIVQQPVL